MNSSWRDITLTIGVKDLMERFRDAERFIAYCKECGCYGRSWGCPPFSFDAGEYLSGWEVAEITATVITVPDGTPVSEAADFITPQRARLDKTAICVLPTGARRGGDWVFPPQGGRV